MKKLKGAYREGDVNERERQRVAAERGADCVQTIEGEVVVFDLKKPRIGRFVSRETKRAIFWAVLRGWPLGKGRSPSGADRRPENLTRARPQK